jgi:hypothetical protein
MVLGNSRAHLRSKAARVGVASPAWMASVPWVVLKVPTTALAMATVTLSKPFRTQLCPSHIASTP